MRFQADNFFLPCLARVYYFAIQNITFASFSHAVTHVTDDYDLLIFHNVTCLEFLLFGDFDWNFLPDFLLSSPNLEVLIVKNVSKYTV